MALRIVTWNCRHFKRQASAAADRTRVQNVVGLLREQDPDIFALQEVTGGEVFCDLVRAMPDHNMFITEGEQTQEILIGSRRRFQTFTTQRLEFKSGASALRPGALHTVVVDDTPYAFLFLHLKSFDDPGGFGIRTDQIERAFRFRETLEAGANQLGFSGLRYVFAGDLNTMGMNLSFSRGDIGPEAEIERLRDAAAGRGMVLAAKTAPATWHSQRSSRTSDLDHVVVSDNVVLRPSSPGGPGVEVIGWPQEPDEQAKRQWVDAYSDHALLRFDVET